MIVIFAIMENVTTIEGWLHRNQNANFQNPSIILLSPAAALRDLPPTCLPPDA